MIHVKDCRPRPWFNVILAKFGMLMNVDFECAVRTLVRMAMAQDPGKCVTTGAVVEEGGAVDQVMPTPDPFTPGRRADCSGGKSVFHRVH
jgi:hypothetical protein